MNLLTAIERAAEITAAACCDVLGTLAQCDATYSDVAVVDQPAGPWADFTYPLVTAHISFTGGITGDNLFVITPAQARGLASAMMGVGDALGEGDLSEIELSAVAEAMNRMLGSVSTAMAREIEVATDIAPPLTALVGSAEEIDESFAAAAFSARFTLRADGLSATIVQMISTEFAEVLASVFDAGDTSRKVLAEHTPAAANRDGAFSAVDRTARITADSAATVLSTLIGDPASATLPEIEAQPDDPLGKLAYPLIFVEVSYVSGVNGSSLFVLSREQAATLACVMMGADEPLGDGLSELELSAVSEAMNQMMGAATNVLADTLRMDIEVAPPTCQVMEDAEEARETFGEAAFCTRFRLVSDRLKADVVQLVPADFAEHLRQAFAAADHGRAVVGSEGQPVAAPGHTAPSAVPPADRPRPSTGTIDPDSVRRVRVRVSAELGRARLPISRVTNLPPGAVVELDRGPHEPVDVLVNGRPFAAAKLVVVDGEYAVQIVSLTPHLVTA